MNSKTKIATNSKQKILLPTLKERQRYVVYKVIGTKNDLSDLHNHIVKECSTMLGLFDGANAGIMGVAFNAKTHKGIIRVNNTYVDKLKTCLGLIKTDGMIIDCDYVSGLLNKAQDKMDTN